MPSRVRLLFSALSFTLLVLAALPLYRELSRPSDIWWTPHAMLVPLAQGADRVEIYVRGKPLGPALEAGQLSAGCGAAACMFLLILTGRLVYRGEIGGA